MKIKRKIIEIDDERCDGCGQCIPSCAEGALEIVDGKARMIGERYCDGLGACLGECPNDALKIVEREAEEFDEAAVEAHLEATGQKASPAEPLPMHGCPSARIQAFGPPAEARAAESEDAAQPTASALSHWPVQIMLVPPTAPFLKQADLLVLADCVPVAYPALHRDFMQRKAVMMGCPKLDDAQAYIDKFAAIFQTAGIKSITTVVMEVPCCSGLPMIVKKGLEASGIQIPMEEVVISTRGQVLQNRNIA